MTITRILVDIEKMESQPWHICLDLELPANATDEQIANEVADVIREEAQKEENQV